MRTSITSFTFLILAVSCHTKNKYERAADEILSNTSTKNMNAGSENYSLYIPDGWTTKRQRSYDVNYYFLLAPKTADDPNTNINVISEDMQNLSLDKYRQKTIESIQKAIPSVKILSQGDVVAGGLRGEWFSYSMEPQDVKTTLVGYIFPKNGVAYIITAGTQTKDAARYRKLFDSVAESLRFTK